jgi:hypothetical protein
MIEKSAQDGRKNLLLMLATRIERLSVDSLWARRASGLRGSLLRALEPDDSGTEIPPEHLDLLIELSFEVLRSAAQEIPDREAQWRRYKQSGE